MGVLTTDFIDVSEDDGNWFTDALGDIGGTVIGGVGEIFDASVDGVKTVIGAKVDDIVGAPTTSDKPADDNTEQPLEPKFVAPLGDTVEMFGTHVPKTYLYAGGGILAAVIFIKVVF